MPPKRARSTRSIKQRFSLTAYIVDVIEFDGKQSVSGNYTQALRVGREDHIFIEAVQSNSKRAWSSPVYVTHQASAVPEDPFAVFVIVFGAGMVAWMGAVSPYLLCFFPRRKLASFILHPSGSIS
jgi:hypothetical protein